MKITDVTLTLFAWDDIPATQYGRHTGRFAGKSDLGLLTIKTDEGVEGHAFLGSAEPARQRRRRVADPVPQADPDGPGPARPRAPLPAHVAAHAHVEPAARARRRGRGAVGHRRQGRRTADPPAAGQLPRAACRAYASSAVLPTAEAYCGGGAVASRREGWTAYKIHPPTEPGARHRGLRGRAQGGRRRLPADARFDLGLQLPRRAARRPGRRAARLPLVRGPAGRGRHLPATSSSSRSSSIPILATEYAPGGHTAYAPWLIAAGDRLPARRRRREGRPHRLLKTAHLAEGFHMNYEVHHGGNSLNNVANLHVIMAIRNCEYLRGAAARRRAEVRPRRGHRGRRPAASCTPSTSRASAPRSTSS